MPGVPNKVTSTPAMGSFLICRLFLKTNNQNINALLPIKGAIVLIILSTILTLIGGIIPSKSAAKKDPVEALRSE